MEEEAADVDGWVEEELLAGLAPASFSNLGRPYIMHLQDGSTIELVVGKRETVEEATMENSS